MESKLQDFIDSNRRYRALLKNSAFVQIFEFLSKPESIDNMAHACQKERPALYGIIVELESLFDEQLEALSQSDSFNLFKQAIGSTINFLLIPYGFRINKQRTLPNSRFFSTSMHYKLLTDKGNLRISSLNPSKAEQSEKAPHSHSASTIDLLELGGTDPAETLSDVDALKIFETLCITKEIGNPVLKRELIKTIKKLLVQWV